MERLISALGLVVFMLLAWAMSSHRDKISWRIIAGGLLLQFGFALLLLKTQWGIDAFDAFGEGVNQLMAHVRIGAKFVFAFRSEDPREPATWQLLATFAFGVLPTIVFFSSLMSILYYMGVMQLVVKGVAWVMQFTLGTSGAESLSAAANIFVGQTEAPLVVKPYLATMTRSELMAVMVGGFATVAGGVMAVYISFGIDAGHLLTASVISAPAALLMAKIMQPEVEEPLTRGTVQLDAPSEAVNFIDAAAIGASDGMKLALNVGAMLIAFLALVSLSEAIFAWVAGLFKVNLTLSQALGYLFSPLAWLMGIESKDCVGMGEVLGIRTVANELVGYQKLGEYGVQPLNPASTEGFWLRSTLCPTIAERSKTIMTYALCGFASLGSIGIQIGGLGALAPERRADLAELGFRAMIGGMLACFMTACFAGILL